MKAKTEFIKDFEPQPAKQVSFLEQSESGRRESGLQWSDDRLMDSGRHSIEVDEAELSGLSEQEPHLESGDL